MGSKLALIYCILHYAGHVVDCSGESLLSDSYCLGVSHTSCVALGMSLNFSMPSFSFCNNNNSNTHKITMRIKLLCMRHLEQCQEQSMCCGHVCCYHHYQINFLACSPAYPFTVEETGSWR